MPARRPAVAGRFYPSEAARLERELSRCLVPENGPRAPAVAVVAPHAGYPFSGAIAGAAFARIAPPERAVVLGPNHTGRGARLALSPDERWDLPGGGLAVDRQLGERLMAEAPLEPDASAHELEHSIEVELPFLRALNPGITFAALCLMRLALDECRALGHAIARAVRDARRVLLVASTDMSHYLPAETAAGLDALALDRIEALDPDGLYRVVSERRISMCGYVPTTVTLFAAQALGATRADRVRYGHSGEITGDHERVVGYASFVIA